MATDHTSRARRASSGRQSDLRFAGMISAGMIATVLTIGALLAPLLAWNDGSLRNAVERNQTVQLSDAPATTTAAAPATGFSVDRPGPAGTSGRAAVEAALAAGRTTLATAAPRPAGRDGSLDPGSRKLDAG